MKIASGNVVMASARNYKEQSRQTIQSVKSDRADMMEKGLDIASKMSGGGKDSFVLSADYYGNGPLVADTYDKNHNVGNIISKGTEDNDAGNAINGFRNSLLSQLLERFSGAGFAGMSGLSGMNGVGNSMGVVGVQSVSEMSYYEFEQTSFSAQGQATTEDGRSILISMWK